MLPSAFRLKRKTEFGKVYARGRSYVTDLIVVYVLPAGRAGAVLPARRPGVRIGFSVSRKLGNAVTRNHVKRLLREASRHLIDSVSGDFDVVVVARRKAAAADFSQLQAAMAALLRRAGLVKDLQENPEA